jgi:hypothetical protein
MDDKITKLKTFCASHLSESDDSDKWSPPFRETKRIIFDYVI